MPVHPSEHAIQIKRRLQEAAPALFLVQVFFTLWIQTQELWLTQARGAQPWHNVILGLPDLLLHQSQSILLGLLLALLWHLNSASPRARRGIVLAASLLLLLQVLDQLFYGLFFDHLQFHFAEEGATTGLGAFWGSFKAVMGPLFILNALAWLALSVWLWKRCAVQPSATAAWPSARSLVWGAALLAVYLLAGVRTGSASARIENHPLLTLLKSLGSAAGSAASPLKGDQGGDLDHLRWGKPSFSARSEQGILDWARQRGQGKAPNVILFTWESVGALDLFKDGELDPALTPKLAAWASHRVLFPSVSTGFPGTVRSHLLLNTGGHTITWGSEEAIVPQDWKGPGLGQTFKENAYSTGLFAASYMLLPSYQKLYERQHWDRQFLPDEQSPAYQAQHQLSSWGIQDGDVVSEACHWIGTQPKDKPFFVQILSSATHHPYNVPATFTQRQNRQGSGGDLAAYQDAIRYSDSLFGQLTTELKAQGRLQDTLIAIVGDHGEAFGLQHKTNLLHKHQVYEENIRSYLLLLDFQLEKGPLSSAKQAWMGDVMPTLLHLARLKPPPKVLGQDLLDPHYQARILYFHKNAHPEKWGLKDGAWKFIAQKLGERQAELYDLDSDPQEQKNLAGQYLERVEAYFQLCEQWYLRANHDYLSLMAHPPDEAAGQEAALGVSGPRLLQVGYRGSQGAFQSLAQVNPLQRLSAYTLGNPYAQETGLIYEWLSPSGYRERVGLMHPAGADETWLDYEPDQALEPGLWELRLYQGQRLLLHTDFSVSSQSALQGPARELKPGKLESLAFGVRKADGSVQEAPFFQPSEKLSAVLTGQPWLQDKQLSFEWIAPSGKTRRFDFRYAKGWAGAWVASQQGLMEEGAWKVNVYDRDRLLISGSFEVSARAPKLRN